MDNYPPNSDKSKLGEYEDKKVERITSSDPIRRKKSLGKSFKNTFFGGDAKTALQYVVFAVLIPSAKEMLAEAGSQGIERLIFGESRARTPASRPSGPLGVVSYNRYSMGKKPSEPVNRAISRRARVTHDFDEIVLTSRQEAEEVIDRLYDIVGQYGSVSVSDLYDMVGIESTHTDMKWGWEELRGAGVGRVRNGYLLDLPDPEPLTT